ncbi:hypothetical protein [Shewanella sp. GXUN23E]|uniref:hypothetical protein n=1 Tax=Shewanella sp. GXUN23E TaxID=3422498 RepID=UPI003D7ED49A
MKTLITTAILSLILMISAHANLQSLGSIPGLAGMERIEIIYEHSLDYALTHHIKEWSQQQMDSFDTDTYHSVREQNLSLIKAFGDEIPVSGSLSLVSHAR